MMAIIPYLPTSGSLCSTHKIAWHILQGNSAYPFLKKMVLSKTGVDNSWHTCHSWHTRIFEKQLNNNRGSTTAVYLISLLFVTKHTPKFLMLQWVHSRQPCLHCLICSAWTMGRKVGKEQRTGQKANRVGTSELHSANWQVICLTQEGQISGALKRRGVGCRRQWGSAKIPDVITKPRWPSQIDISS